MPANPTVGIQSDPSVLISIKEIDASSSPSPKLSPVSPRSAVGSNTTINVLSLDVAKYKNYKKAKARVAQWLENDVHVGWGISYNERSRMLAEADKALKKANYETGSNGRGLLQFCVAQADRSLHQRRFEAQTNGYWVLLWAPPIRKD